MEDSATTAALRRFGRPALRYLDNRFEEVKALLRDRPPAEPAVGAVPGPTPGLAPDVAAAMQRVQLDAATSADTVAGLAGTIDRRLERFLQEQAADDPTRQVALGTYRPDVVLLLNKVLSFDGPIAERSLLVNHPLAVFFDEHGPRLFEVNERIVEIPFAMGTAALLPPASRVVDVGATESTVALSLASLGHSVVALDPRRYPFEHPNLTAVAAEVAHWDPPEPVDLVVAVSAVEHFGLDGYTPGHASGTESADADHDALRRFRRWLAPGGRLVLTVPTGPATTDDFQRVYDEPRLEQLVDGWKVERAEHARRAGPTTWEPTDRPPTEGRGVAMLQLS